MTLQRPNSDQANDGSLPGITRDVLESWLRDSVDGMLPAQVVSYDHASNRAKIKPVIKVGMTDGGSRDRAEVASVPTLRLGGGGFFVNIPIKAGDKGWIFAADRDISVFLQTNENHPPPSKRFHSFSSGLFVPDTLRDWNGNSDALTLQSLDGAVAIELHADKVVQKVGAIAYTMDATGHHFQGGTLTHNGVNVGYNHQHTAVQTGDDLSGGPTP